MSEEEFLEWETALHYCLAFQLGTEYGGWTMRRLSYVSCPTLPFRSNLLFAILPVMQRAVAFLVMQVSITSC